MARKFVMLAWDCPGCDTENAGPRKFCVNCGAPQPENVRFHEPTGGYKDVTDPKEIEEAAKGPDVHCPFCGTRNADGATKCTQCGGKLKGGKRRKTGDRLETEGDEGIDQGEYTRDEDDETGVPFDAPAPVSPSYSYSPEPAFEYSGLRVDKALLTNIGIGLVAALIVGFISWFVYMKWFNVTEVPVTLNSFSWQTEIHIGEIFTYHEEGWSIPAGGRQTSSEERATGRYEQKQECKMVPVTTTKSEPCGSHIEDRGNGYGESVTDYCTVSETHDEQKCEMVDDTSRPIYDTWYYYDIDRWTQTRTVPTSGNGNTPEWPAFVPDFC